MRLSSAQAKNRGFTLLELTIVLVIGGLIVTPFLHLYTVKKKQEQLDTTKKETFAIQYALQAYMKTNKKFPCPADPTIAMTASGWQKEVDCAANATRAAGVKSTIGRANQEIWIGSVPLAALNLAGEFGTDSWGGRYTYAVTRPLTLPDTNRDVNNLPDGAISVVDETGATVLETADTARFMIVSHGINRQGVYTTAGVRTTCPAAGDPNTGLSEGENCNDDKTFVISAVFEGAGPIHSDDYAINDMTTNAVADDSPLGKLLVCNNKGMFYRPTSTNPVPDADGCVASGGVESSLETYTFNQLIAKNWRIPGYGSQHWRALDFTIPFPAQNRDRTIVVTYSPQTATGTQCGDQCIQSAYSGGAMIKFDNDWGAVCSAAAPVDVVRFNAYPIPGYNSGRASTTCTFTLPAGQARSILVAGYGQGGPFSPSEPDSPMVTILTLTK